MIKHFLDDRVRDFSDKELASWAEGHRSKLCGQLQGDYHLVRSEFEQLFQLEEELKRRGIIVDDDQ